MSDIFKAKINNQWVGIPALLGEKGDKGDQGIQGPAATIAVGTVTTGQPGTNASVTNSGTTSAAVFDFTIPRGNVGATGPQGPQGEQGIQGIQGIQGETGPAGTAATISVGNVTAGPTPTVTNTGTSTAAVFDFVLAQGPAATINVGTTTTGQPGTNASVTNSGTTSAAVFDFTIPQGATGAAAGINSATASVTTLGRNDAPTVSASVSGPDTAKDFSFSFGLPKVSQSYWFELTATGWTLDSSTGRYTKTRTFQDIPITANSLLWIGADPASMDEIYSKVIYPSGQGDHSLTFTAYSQPTQTVTFGVMIV